MAQSSGAAGRAAVSGNSPVWALAVGLLLTAVTVPMGRRLAVEEGDIRFARLVIASVVLRFACTFLQVFLVTHVYHGVADYTRYVTHGAELAPGFRHGHFADGFGLSGNGTVDLAAGMVFAVIGVHETAGFIVFSWLSLLGLLAFYRAFRLAVPDGDRLRYATLILLLPSLLYWPSVIGKEALMLWFLGVGAHGVARLLTHTRGAVLRIAFGLGLGTLLRPNEAILLFFGLFVGFVVASRRRRSLFGTLATFVVLIGVGGGLLVATQHFVHSTSLSPTDLSHALRQTHHDNGGVGAGFGSSNYAYSSNVLRYPQDVYTVLFRPLPFQAHSVTQLIAAAENMVVLVVLVGSWRRLRVGVARVARQPYLALSFVYSVLFLYFFAALGNLGLLDRERTLLFPLLFVLVSVRPPAAPAAVPMAGRPAVARSVRAVTPR